MRTPAAARPAALAAAILFAVGCTPAHGTGLIPRASSSALPSLVQSPARGVFARGFSDPGMVVTASDLYLTWDLPPDGQRPRRAELARADPRTGAIEARNTFSPGFLGVPLPAAGWLWVTDSTSEGELLLQLDPVTLVVTGELMVSRSRYPGGAHIAYAGGWLWADGGGQLLRVSAASVQPAGAIALPGASSSGVGASPDGAVLVVTEHGSVQRRDPRTGDLLASRPLAGTVDGVTGSGAWVTAAGRAELLSPAAMTPGAAIRLPDGQFTLRVAAGLLWVTDGQGGGFCADARTGRRLGAVPAAGGELLAVGRILYYAVPAGQGGGARIRSVAIPAACRNQSAAG
jgi:hypothetical protein